MTTPIPLTSLVQEFFRAHLIKRRDVSPHTLHAYRDALRPLLSYAASRAGHDLTHLTLDDLGRETVLQFLDQLETSRHNSARTRNSRLAAIHAFFRFVAEEDPSALSVCQQVMTIPYKQTPTVAVTCLDRDEVEHILGAIPRTDPSGRRDAALLQFLYNTGARAQEVVDLHLPAIRFEAPFMVRLMGKGRRERLCPLWTQTVSLIRDTLRDRKMQPQDDLPAFLNAAGHPLTRFGLRYIVATRVALATLSRPSLATRKISPHTFRHTTALHLLQSGVEINVVRSWLGHVSIETTHAYIEIDMKMKRAALEACSPVKAGKGQPSWKDPDLLAWLEAL